MKHKTFTKENEKKLKQIIKAQKDEIRRLEVEIRELKSATQSSKKPKERKPKKVKEPKNQAMSPTKEAPKAQIKVKPPMTAEQRSAFCEKFSKRFKENIKGTDGTDESKDD